MDTTSATLLPMVVSTADLGIGTARLMTAGITMNQLIGPAVGATLFAAGMAWPFVAQAVCLGLGAVLISRMTVPPLTRPAERHRAGRDIAEGFRWTWGTRSQSSYEVGPDGNFLVSVPAEEPGARPVVAVLDWSAGLPK